MNSYELGKYMSVKLTSEVFVIDGVEVSWIFRGKEVVRGGTIGNCRSSDVVPELTLQTIHIKWMHQYCRTLRNIYMVLGDLV